MSCCLQMSNVFCARKHGAGTSAVKGGDVHRHQCSSSSSTAYIKSTTGRWPPPMFSNLPHPEQVGSTLCLQNFLI